MKINEAIQAFLGVTPDPIGTEGRNYFYIAQERPVAPYLVFGHTQTEDTFNTHCGPPSLIEQRWEFTIWDSSQSRGFEIARLLRVLVHGKTVTMGTLRVTCRFEHQMHGYDQENKLHGEHLEICLTY